MQLGAVVSHITESMHRSLSYSLKDRRTELHYRVRSRIRHSPIFRTVRKPSTRLSLTTNFVQLGAVDELERDN